MIEFGERCDMLLSGEIPQGGICAELGVWAGEFSAHIRDKLRPKELHLFDIWFQIPGVASKGDGELLACLLSTRQRLREEILGGEIFLHHGMLPSVLSSFQQDYFDFMYIDSDHRYESCLKDLWAANRLVHRGGIIAGHDYKDHRGYGVIRAVTEFCDKSPWRLYGLSKQGGYSGPDPDGRQWPSYMLKQ
jgi:hypothetical protein